MENQSGQDLGNVSVHYGSDRPAQVGALAYAQGDHIHLAPGQERHLPHEAWHVVQQRQGRVGTTGLVAGKALNDDPSLEAEASKRGAEAQSASTPDMTAPLASPSLGQPATASPSGPIQRVDPVTMTIAGITLSVSEITAIIGTTTAVASAVGAVAQASNGDSGNAGQMKLGFDSPYLMTETARRNLRNVAHALFFEELKSLAERRTRNEETHSEDEYKAELKEIAKGNTQLRISQVLDENCSSADEEFVANGDGLRRKVTPWGSARVVLSGGFTFPTDFSATIYRTANEKGIAIESMLMDVLKSCILYFDQERDVDTFSDDDIYVRGQGVDYVEEDGRMKVVADVAFDWDGDTSYYRWRGDTAMSTRRIPSPAWGGPSDPDD